MSISALRQVFAEKLGERDTRRFSDVHLQNLLDKEYRDEGALQDATREGLRTPPALPPALIDKILKVFGQPGERFADQNPAFLSHKTLTDLTVYQGRTHQLTHVLCMFAFPVCLC